MSDKKEKKPKVSEKAVAAMSGLKAGDSISYHRGVAKILAVIAPGVYVPSSLALEKDCEAIHWRCANGNIMTAYELAAQGFVRGAKGFDAKKYQAEQKKRKSEMEKSARLMAKLLS